MPICIRPPIAVLILRFWLSVGLSTVKLSVISLISTESIISQVLFEMIRKETDISVFVCASKAMVKAEIVKIFPGMK